MTTQIKPPLAYYGGKTRLAGAIAAMLPAHEHYIEPFAGSCSVLLAKRASRMETVNDLHGDLMTFWKVLRDDPAGLARVCHLTPHSRAEYAAACQADLTSLSDLERARLVWIRLTQGRTGTLRSSTTQGNGRSDRVEVLWSNRPLVEPEPVLDFEALAIRHSEAAGAPAGDETRSVCELGDCAKVFVQPTRGRRRRYCSPACRTQAWRSKQSLTVQ